MLKTNDYPSTDDVIFVDWHHAGPFDTPGSSSRAAFLGASSAPDTYFDGIDNIVGAGDSVATYNSYKSIVDNHYVNDGSKFIFSGGTYDFDLDAGTVEATFTVEVSAGETVTTSNFLQAGMYEDDLFACCEPQTGNAFWDHIGRNVTPTETLTAVNGGETQVFTQTMTVDPSWDPDNLHLFGWVNRSGGKVMQAGMLCEARYLDVANLDGAVGSSVGVKDFAVETTYRGCIADDVTVTLDKSGLPAGWDAELVVGVSTFPTSASLGNMSENDLQSYTVRVLSSGAPSIGTLSVTTEPNTGGRGRTVEYNVFHDSPAILFVDDDRGGTSEVQFESSITASGNASLTWDLDAQGSPLAENLSGYNIVIWNTGELQGGTIGGVAQNALIDFLDNGGGVFVTSQGYMNHQGTGPLFSSDYLRVASFTQDVQAISCTGVAADPIGDGLSFALSPPFTDLGDAIVPGAGAQVWLQGQNGDVGIRYDSGSFRTVFMSAAFEGVPGGDDTLVLDRVIDWLLEGQSTDVTPVPQAPATRVSLAQNRPNPFSDATSVKFSVPRSGPVSLSVYNVTGRKVVDLVNRTMDAGTYEANWNGRDASGARVAGGVYFYRLQASGESLTKEMVRLK